MPVLSPYELTLPAVQPVWPARLRLQVGLLFSSIMGVVLTEGNAPCVLFSSMLLSAPLACAVGFDPRCARREVQRDRYVMTSTVRAGSDEWLIRRLP